jgi:hypothetical protein
MLNYGEDNALSYQYIVRTRPDSRIMQNILPIFNMIKPDGKLLVFAECEQLIISHWSSRKIFELITRCPIYYSTKTDNDRFAPEWQFFCLIENVIRELGGVKTESIGIRPSFDELLLTHHGDYNFLYRGNNKYAYSNQTVPPPDTPGFVWDHSKYIPNYK